MVISGGSGENQPAAFFTVRVAMSTLMSRARLSEASRKMMRAANVFYLTRVAIVAMLCIATLAGGTIWWSHNKAREYMERLTAASTAEVPEILNELEGTYVGRLVMEKFGRLWRPGKERRDLSRRQLKRRLMVALLRRVEKRGCRE